MPDSIIKVENLSKKFIIRHEQRERYTSLRDVVTNNVKSIFSKKDKVTTTQEEFWALKDINFEIKQGDRVGIIGRNGAGKSTLLKVLSRIVEPSTGRVELNGRVSSLLEVGTGFHPELTGRENIFLNGAILGMSRAEIRSKFDEIVAFAEVEKFLDTPVKRYSSGMYVRLAFAVAAHLEPEILIVDEVLAVGDAQFQKKCLGKMEDVSKNEGRTVLFVSHNMGVIAQLCQSSIILNKGSVVFQGSTSLAIENYISNGRKTESGYVASQEAFSKAMFIKSVTLLNKNELIAESFLLDEPILIELTIGINDINPSAKLSITLQNVTGDFLSTIVEEITVIDDITSSKEVKMKIQIADNQIAPNVYSLRFALFVFKGEVYDLIEMVCPFSVVDSGSKMALYEGNNYGSFILNYKILA